MQIDIEGFSLDFLKALPREEQDQLLGFSGPISFAMGSAVILAEFNRTEDDLIINLAHIDRGGEGVLLVLSKLLRAYAADREFRSIRWNIHALTCAKPNPKLQHFLRTHDFAEVDDPHYGPIFTRTEPL